MLLLHRSREIQQRLVETSPENPGWAYGLAVNHSHIGDHLDAAGDTRGALAEFQAARTISDSLLTGDPTNTRWLFSLSQDHRAVAFALDALGRSDEALEVLQQASSLNGRLVEIDPTNVEWRCVGCAPRKRNKSQPRIPSRVDMASGKTRLLVTFNDMQRTAARDMIRRSSTTVQKGSPDDPRRRPAAPLLAQQPALPRRPAGDLVHRLLRRRHPLR